MSGEGALEVCRDAARLAQGSTGDEKGGVLSLDEEDGRWGLRASAGTRQKVAPYLNVMPAAERSFCLYKWATSKALEDSLVARQRVALSTRWLIEVKPCRRDLHVLVATISPDISVHRTNLEGFI